MRRSVEILLVVLLLSGCASIQKQKEISEIDKCTRGCYKHILADKEMCSRSCIHLINGIPYEDME